MISGDLGKLILRVGFAGFMLLHGFPKLQKLINGDFNFPDPIGIGAEASLLLTVFAEFVCSIFIIIGYKTKYAIVPLIITMLVAALVVHGNDPWQKKEFALLYAIGFLAIGLLGNGKYSIEKHS